MTIQNVKIALCLGQIWFGQSWCWPNLVKHLGQSWFRPPGRGRALVTLNLKRASNGGLRTGGFERGRLRKGRLRKGRLRKGGFERGASKRGASKRGLRKGGFEKEGFEREAPFEAPFEGPCEVSPWKPPVKQATFSPQNTDFCVYPTPCCLLSCGFFFSF